MRRKFDPVAQREFWLKVRLPYTIGQDPSNLPPLSRVPYSQMQAGALVNAHLLGLSKELQATMERQIAGMEDQPEPNRADYVDGGLSDEGWRDDLHEWRQLLGVFKWLVRGDRAFSELTAATAANWQLIELANKKLGPSVRASRRAYMSGHLATALAADAPLIGLKIFTASRMAPPVGAKNSPLRFAHWACQDLVNGGTRDEAFVARGRAMLQDSLLSEFYQEAETVELALWLKVIYFDSGIVDTPEGAFARAYDSMPGIDRPDFIAP